MAEGRGERLFFETLRRALGHPPQPARPTEDLFPQEPSAQDLRLLAAVSGRSAREREELVERLFAAAAPLHLQVEAVADLASAREAVLRLAAEKTPEWGGEKQLVAWSHPLLEGLGLAEPLARQGIPLWITHPVDPRLAPEAAAEERRRQRSRIAASFIGITAADFCLAETATVVLRSRPGEPRSVALLPSIHIALLRRGQILADMKELFALLRWDERFRGEGLSPYLSFISGPSKTADIEATMVHGAHGPREMYLLILPDETPAAPTGQPA